MRADGWNSRHLLRALVVGLGCSLVAFAVQYALWPVIPPSPHLFFYPAVILAAYLGGWWAGLIAVLGACVAIAYFFLPPTGISIGEPADALDLVLFAVMGSTLAALIDRLSVQRRQAEAARRKATLADISRAQVLSFVSHDLKGPLTAIGLSASRMQKTLATSDVARDGLIPDLDRIKRAADRMQRIVQTVLDVARVDVHAMRLDIQNTEVRPMVEEVADMFEPVAATKSVSIQCRVSTRRNALCDRDRLLRVLTNLTDNALKFAPVGGRIEVRARSEANDIVFEVTNNGPAISQDDTRKVFNPYWKADERASGQGLGLYIVRLIVEKHGGSIAAHSKPDKGVTFRFTIPAAGIESQGTHEVSPSY